MTQTIEEAARLYAESLYESGMYDKETPANKEDMCYAFKAGVNYVYGLPLASRLTAEEKERVRAMYSEAQSWLDEKISFDNPNEQLKICAVAIQDRLERIFGTDFFKEGE